MPIIKQVTLRTIAYELGLTVQTVSKALRGKPGMSEQTRYRVIQTAERLGYFTKEQIRSLRAEHILPYPLERMRFLLVQTSHFKNLYPLLLEGLRERFASLGHQIELLKLPVRIRASAMDDWIEKHHLHYIDGLFLAPGIHPEAWESKLLELPVPKMLLGYPPLGSKVDSVIWDIYEATYQAVAYLRSIGHRRILYTGDTVRQRGYILRWQAFVHAMQQFGEPVDPAHHLTGDHSRRDSWLHDLSDRIAQHAPTAILCGVNREVTMVYDWCRNRLGLRIPEHLSLIGLLNEQPDDLPPFTMPRLPIRETGYRAADRMLWRIANQTLPYEHIRLQGELRIGSTTAPPTDRPTASASVK